MTEHLSNPFTAYNSAAPDATTLVGNWYEERCLKDTTGVTRGQTINITPGLEESIYSTRQDTIAELPTFPRVIAHTEQLLPAEWIPLSKISYQPPSQRTHELAQYKQVVNVGPRELQELELLAKEAANIPAPQPAPPCFDTTTRVEYQPHDLQGLQLGARVMRDQDGRPVSRDVTFLTEKNIIPKARADRIMTAGSLTMTAATRTARLPDPEVPITLYTEAAAKNPNCGNFYVRPIL
eukprot:jgi/Chrzof1/11150/Cz05g25210.t1